MMKSSEDVLLLFFNLFGLSSDELSRRQLGAEVAVLEVVDVEVERAHQRQQKVTGMEQKKLRIRDFVSIYSTLDPIFFVESSFKSFFLKGKMFEMPEMKKIDLLR